MGIEFWESIAVSVFAFGIGAFFLFASTDKYVPGWTRVIGVLVGLVFAFVGGSLAWHTLNPHGHDMAAYRAYELYQLDQAKRRLGVP